MFINRSNSKKAVQWKCLCTNICWVNTLNSSNRKTNADFNATLSLSSILILSLPLSLNLTATLTSTPSVWSMNGRHPIECICDECLPIFPSDVVPSFNIWETINVPSVVLPVDNCSTSVHAEVPPHVICKS
jgi:hypothetical protein